MSDDDYQEPYLKIDYADRNQEALIEDLRKRLADAGFGVTVVGQFLTIRWGDRSLCQVAAVIVGVDEDSQ